MARPAGSATRTSRSQRRGFAWERRPIGWLRILTDGRRGFRPPCCCRAVRADGARAVDRRRRSSSRRCCASCSAPRRRTRTSRSTRTTGGRCSRSTARAPASAGGALWIPDSPVDPRRGVRGDRPDARGRRRARSCCSGTRGARRVGGRPAAGPAHDPRRASACSRSRSSPSRPASTSATCSRSSALAAILVAVSWRWAVVVRGRRRRDVPEHVRGAGRVLREPARLRLAGDRRRRCASRSCVGARRAAPLRRVPVGRRAAAAGRAAIAARELARGRGATGPGGADADAARTAARPEPDRSARRPRPAARAGRRGPAARRRPRPPARRRARSRPACVPAWYDRPSWTEMGPIAWLRARIERDPAPPRPVSARLDHERRGRIDRLDLFMVVVLVRRRR